MEYFLNNFNITIDLERDKLLSEAGIATLKDRYFLQTEKSAQEVFARSACTFGTNQEHAQRIYDYMSKCYFMASTPILSNAGTKRGMPISCFLSDVDDSMEGILEHHMESGYLASYGGGVGTDWSSLRSAGSSTSRGNTSTGLIPFVKMADTQMLAVQQGSTRRGAYAAYLDISHPEIEEFISLRTAGGSDPSRRCLGTGFHHGVNVPDLFMKAVQAGQKWSLIDPHTREVKKQVDARTLWMEILIKRLETGEPYLYFTDTANSALPKHLADRGYRINASNLCVAPETLILTKEGHKEIAHFVNDTITIWNGEEWSEVTVVKTGENKELIRVTYSDGSSLDCTPEHKFYIQENYYGPSTCISAKDLKSGMKLEKWILPSFDIEEEGPDLGEKFWYSQGFYAGDGVENLNHSWLYFTKFCCQDRLIGSFLEEQCVVDRKTWKHGKMCHKYTVPTNSSIKTRINWLAGYLDADGCVVESTNGQNIQVTSTNRSFLFSIKLMLQLCGVHSSLTFRKEEGNYLLPLNDGSGEYGEFLCKELWLLNINCFGVKQLLNLGLNCSRLVFKEKQDPQRDAARFLTVFSIERTNRISDTFCFSESKRHKGVFNGVCTGQCTEIMLPTNSKRTAVCCLSSVNLEFYDEWKNDKGFIFDVMEFLDNVLEYFITNAPKSMWRAVASAKAERSVGLGTMGFHLFLQKRGVPFESAVAIGLNKGIFKHIQDYCHYANLTLGKMRGEAPDAKDCGLRFSHCMAIAPTASISLICGNTSPSIEPYNANAFDQRTMSGAFLIKNKHLEYILKEHYSFDDEKIKTIWSDIIMHKGSVQHLPWMLIKDKLVFKTAMELDQMWIIEHAAHRQPFIDQGQSVNLFLSPTVHKNILNKLHMEAWTKGLKSLYYLRSEAAKQTVIKPVEDTQVISYDEAMECVSCQ